MNHELCNALLQQPAIGNDGSLVFPVGMGVLLAVSIWWGLSNMKASARQAERRATLTPEQRAEQDAFGLWGALNAAMVCAHCQTKGQIRTKTIQKKQGISGGKATAAVLTGGVSMLATGLSREEGMTQAHCDTCNNTWNF